MNRGLRHPRLAGAAFAVLLSSACSTEKIKDLPRLGKGSSAVTAGTVVSTPLDVVAAGGASGVDSVGIFAKTAHPLSVKWCGACHGTSQAPLFAATDAASSYEVVMATSKVDLQAVDKSRLVLRLSVDKHNCPADPGCEAAAKQMTDAITTWAEQVKSAAKAQETAVVSETLAFADAKEQTILGENPAGVLAYFAANFTAKAPMVAVNDATSGNLVLNSAKGKNNTDANGAAGDNSLGTATLKATVVTDGTYTMSGLVNAPAAGQASFFVRIDGGALMPWLIKPNAATYTWENVSATAGGTPTNFTLKAGEHTVEIRQREGGAQLARLVIKSVAKFDPSLAQATSRKAKQLRFDIATASKIPGAVLAIELEDYAANAYLFRNPTLTISSGSVHVKDVKIGINGTVLPQNATFTVVDKVVAAPGGTLSTAAMIAVKDQGADKDQFSVSIGTIEAK